MPINLAIFVDDTLGLITMENTITTMSSGDQEINLLSTSDITSFQVVSHSHEGVPVDCPSRSKNELSRLQDNNNNNNSRSTMGK